MIEIKSGKEIIENTSHFLFIDNGNLKRQCDLKKISSTRFCSLAVLTPDMYGYKNCIKKFAFEPCKPLKVYDNYFFKEQFLLTIRLFADMYLNKN